MRQVTDPRSLVTAYTVDGLGNTTQQQSPDTGTTNATYDVAGNLTSRTDARGKTTTFSYDAVNRLTQASYASGTPTVLEYDGGTSPLPNDIGKLTKVIDEAGSTRFRYNGFGNVVSKTQTTTANGVAKDQTIAYAYGTSGSSTGHVVSATYPSGNVVGYSYSSAGRIAGLTLTTANGSVALLSNIQYQPFGKPSAWTWGNGTAYTRSFDLSGRLTQFPLGATTGTGTTPNGLSRTVNYDAASRISAYTHTDTSGGTGSSTATAANQTFGYDDQDRLISYLPANSSQSYSYDANGNRTGQTIGGNSYTQTVDPASNRQTASTGPTATTNSYDAAGSLTSDGTVTYSYSDRGRLASVTKNGTTTSYLYNALGQRVVKSGTNVPSGATRYVYDEAGHLIGEYDQSGNALQETVYLGDTPVVTIKNATPYYIYADQIDTPRVITDTNNLMVWRWDQTDPFGATLPDENPTSLGAFTYNPRFPGQVYDQETGKHYNANRDYDPASGRYVQSDPIGLNGGQWSTYAYVAGNPINFVDPNGLTMYSDDFMGPLPRDGYRTSQMTKTRCGLVPPSPPGVDIVQNMSLAKSKINPVWFRNMVKNKGPWDYKQQGSIYQDFGNFNYGATGKSFGFYRQILLQEAGRAQQAAGTSRPEWGYPPSSRWDIYGGQPPYGDDPGDQEQINNGVNFCQCMGY